MSTHKKPICAEKSSPYGSSSSVPHINAKPTRFHIKRTPVSFFARTGGGFGIITTWVVGAIIGKIVVMLVPSRYH